MRGVLLATTLLVGLSSGEVPESCYSHIDVSIIIIIIIIIIIKPLLVGAVLSPGR